LTPYLFVRPGELRGVVWSEFDFNDNIWRIPANKMKMKRIHLVLLASQVVTLLQELNVFTGNNDLLFPNPVNKNNTISNRALLSSLNKLGYSNKDICQYDISTFVDNNLFGFKRRGIN
jgi:integrase